MVSAKNSLMVCLPGQLRRILANLPSRQSFTGCMYSNSLQAHLKSSAGSMPLPTNRRSWIHSIWPQMALKCCGLKQQWSLFISHGFKEPGAPLGGPMPARLMLGPPPTQPLSWTFWVSCLILSGLFPRFSQARFLPLVVATLAPTAHASAED